MSVSPARRHLWGAALGLVAAALLIFSAWSSAWWSGQDGGLSVSAGLRAVEQCSPAGCQQAALASLGGQAWMQVGIGAFTAAMVGAALLFAGVARVFRAPTRRSSVPGAAAIACVAAAALGVVYIVLTPANVSAFGIALAMPAHFAGAAIGAGTGLALLTPREAPAGELPSTSEQDADAPAADEAETPPARA